MKPSTQDFQQWMAGMNMTCRFMVDSSPDDLATNQLATNCVVDVDRRLGASQVPRV